MIRVIAVYTMRFAILTLVVFTAIIPPVCAGRWTPPQATEIVPTPHLPKRTPVTTPGPQVHTIQQVWNVFQQKGICGFLDGDASLPVTCLSESYVCATNTYLGNHGCCDPYQPAESCILPTSCVASTRIKNSCDERCKEDDFITKCLRSDAPYCATLTYIYPVNEGTTIMVFIPCNHDLEKHFM